MSEVYEKLMKCYKSVRKKTDPKDKILITGKAGASERNF